VWASPGQWGSAAVFAFLLASAGGLVVNRAARADVTWTFLACYAALWLGRSLWLGDPLVIPLHRLENGALVLFAFFMISDPRTTPDSRAGRILFAVLVAVGAYVVQFKLFRTNGLLWSLAVCSLVVPLFDRRHPLQFRFHLGDLAADPHFLQPGQHAADVARQRALQRPIGQPVPKATSQQGVATIGDQSQRDVKQP